MMEEVSKHFDYILLGTGLVESILSCALAKRGKKVLHFDQNDYYGELFVSGNLSNMMKYFHPDQVFDEERMGVDHPKAEKRLGQESGSILAQKSSNFLLVPEDGSSQLNQRKQLNLLQTYQRYFSRYYPASKKSSFLHPAYFHLLAKPDPSNSSPTQHNREDNLHPAFQSLMTLGEEEQFLQLLIHLDRYFNIDLSPKMIYCSGKLINAIVQSNTHHYFEFKPLTSFYYFLSDNKASRSSATTKIPFQLWKVPSNKNDIFLSSHLSALEKRTLMKFYQYIFDWSKLQKGDNLLLLNEKELMSGRALYRPQNKSIAVNSTSPSAEDASIEEAKASAATSTPDIIYNSINYKDKTFLEFLQAFKLSEKLQWTIIYSLCLHYGAMTSSVTTTPPSAEATKSYQQILNKPIHHCLQDLSLYFNSIGIFGDMAFLTPLYGIGEIVQGFCRMSAVWGTTFMLRQTITTVASIDMAAIQDKKGGKEEELATAAVDTAKEILEHPCKEEDQQELNEEDTKQSQVSPSLPPTLQVTDRNGNTYTCNKLIANMSYFPSTVTCLPFFSYHLIVILGLTSSNGGNKMAEKDGTPRNSSLAAFFPEERSVGIIPPDFHYQDTLQTSSSSLKNPYAIYIHQYDHSTESAPEGMTLLHFHTMIPDTSSGEGEDPCLLEQWESRAANQFPTCQALTQQLMQLLRLREQVNVVDWRSSSSAGDNHSAVASTDYQIMFSRDFLRPVTPSTAQSHPTSYDIVLTPSLDFSSLHLEHEVELAQQILYDLLVMTPEEREAMPPSEFRLFEDEKRPEVNEDMVPTGTGELESEEAIEASEYMKIYESYVVPATSAIETENQNSGAEVQEEKEKVSDSVAISVENIHISETEKEN